jgi:endonuclease YncB( thermonuclease family)
VITRSLASLLLVTLVTPLSWANDLPAGVPGEAKWVKVDRVVDGDTIVLMNKTRVRLHGIDTPERDQHYGKQATRALEGLIKTKVFVEEKDTDRYGRLVGVLYTAEGLNVNLEMVCSGHAWWYERYAPESKILEDCQTDAQQESKGLWKSEAPAPPWEWRRKK